MKKVALVLCALTPFAAVCADGRRSKKVVTVCAMDALIERGLMTQNSDGSWTTNENIGRVAVTGLEISSQGIKHNVVNVQTLTPEEIAYKRAKQERKQLKKEAKARQRQADARRQAAEAKQRETEDRERARREETSAVHQNSSSNRFAGCSVKAYSFNIGEREATREEKPQWMRDEEDNGIYVAVNLNVVPHVFRIMANENDLRPGEIVNSNITGSTVEQVKAQYGIKD